MGFSLDLGNPNLMTTPHEFTGLDVDLDDIREQVSAALGKPVGVVARWPVADRPGVLLFEDDATAERIDVDPAVVEQALTVTRTRERERDDDPGPLVFAGLLADLTAATDVAVRWAVVLRLLQRLAQREAAENQRARDDRRARRRARAERIEQVATQPPPFLPRDPVHAQRAKDARRALADRIREGR